MPRLGSKRGKSGSREGKGPFSKAEATPLPAGITPSGSWARAGVRMQSVSRPALCWALRSNAWATSLAEPSPPTQTTLENKKLHETTQDFNVMDNHS